MADRGKSAHMIERCLQHDHFRASRQLNRASHVGGAEVELGTVALEDACDDTFLFGQNVDLCSEFGVAG